eukprot:scaffold7.g3738.t1
MQTPAYAGQLSDKLFTEKRNSPFSPNNAVATELQSDPKETSQLLKDIARVLQSPIPSPAGYVRQLEAQLQAERASGAGAEGHSGGMASGARRMSAPPPVGTRPASAEARRGSAAPALMSPLLISPRKRSAAEATAKQLVASLEHMLADGSSAAGSMALSALHSCSSTLAAAEALQAIAAELSGVAVDESPPRLPGGAGRRLSVLASPAPSGMVRQQSVSRLPGSPHRLSVAGGAMLDASPVPSPLAAFGLAAPASPRSPRSPMAGRGGGSPRARSSLVVGMALPPIECIVLPEPQLDLTPPEGLRFEAEARELLAALADFGDAERRAAGRHRAEVGARLDELFRWPPPARAVAL